MYRPQHVKFITTTKSALLYSYARKAETKGVVMAYSPKLAEFVFKASWDAITKYKAGDEDAEKLATLVANISELRRNGIITDAQIDALSSYLGVYVPVPDAPDTYEEHLEAVQRVANATAEDQTILSDAIAELSEVVSTLFPTE